MQNASPWSIRRFIIRGPISWLPVLVLTCRVIVQLLITFFTKATSLSLILCIFRTSISQTCEMLSKVFFTSIQVQDKLLLFFVASSNIALLISTLSMHPIDPVIPPLWSSSIHWWTDSWCWNSELTIDVVNLYMVFRHVISRQSAAPGFSVLGINTVPPSTYLDKKAQVVSPGIVQKCY